MNLLKRAHFLHRAWRYRMRSEKFGVAFLRSRELGLKQANAKRPFLPLWHGECAQSLSSRRRVGRLRGLGCRRCHVDLGCTSCGQG